MRFNTAVKTENKIQNYEGGTSFTFEQSNPKLHLYMLTTACLFNEPKFYGQQGDIERQIVETCKVINEIDQLFVPKLAVYCREQMYLRTTPTVLITESWINWGRTKNKSELKKYTERVLLRIDDMMEMFVYWNTRTNNHTIPNALKKVFKKRLENASKYELAKYSESRNKVKLKDIIIMTHPKGDFKEIIEGKLKNTETWESHISVEGSTKESWEKILPKIPTLAFLRNLRNLEQKSIDLKEILPEKLSKERIVKSKIFPFQIYSAYKNVESNYIKKHLDSIISYTYENLPKVEGYTAVFSDVSGSMDSRLSGKGTMTYKEVAILSGLFSSRIFNNSIFGVFATDFKMVPYSPNDSVFEKTDTLQCDYDLGGGTEAWKTVRYLLDTKTKVDRIIIFSDCITYNSYGDYQLSDILRKYRQTVNPDCIFYNIDLSSYGQPTVPEGPNNYFINGWSEKIFNYIGALEKGKKQNIDTLINSSV